MDAGPGTATPNSREDAMNELSRVYATVEGMRLFEKAVAHLVHEFAAIQE